ncbi:MAG: C25 family cysteine peptidase [candidate division WOR-3 bacterium]
MKFFCAVILMAGVCLAGVVNLPITISPEQVSVVSYDGWSVVKLNLDQNGMVCVTTTAPGEPLLPVISGNVLIPPDAQLKRVVLKNVHWQEIATGLSLYPCQPMRPVSQFNSVPFVQPKPEIYQSDVPYPAEVLNPVPAGTKSGFRIAGLLFCPFQYYPQSGRLLLATGAEIEVEYEENAAPANVLTLGQFEAFKEDVHHLVVNNNDLNRFSPIVAELDQEELDVAIVTSSALISAVAPFADYLQRKGYFTEVMPTETIYARYSGRDNPEKIRNFLKDCYAHRGLKYVILAGDVQHVPCRYGYLPYSPYNVPADLYYSDLDGTWDANNNSQFGEYDYTNFNPDSVDLYSDIVVGRLPFDDSSNCANFLKKDSLYERHPDTTYLHNVLLPFEGLWTNIDYYGRIVNKNIAIALSEMANWLVDSVYNMTPTQCVTSINSGRHLFHFAGHGSTSAFGSTFSTSNLSSLTNVNMPCIVNSMACDCGNFDQYDCLGEQFVNTTNGGAVSTCLNARYGWGAPPNMGPSENLCMEFYNNYVKGFNQGRAYALAKDFLRNAAFSQMTYRWSLYDWTLQGDPTMLMWRTIPKELVVTCPDTIEAKPQVLTVEVNYEGYQPAAGARVAILHQNQLLGRALTNSLGIAKVCLSAIEDTQTLTLSITAQDGAPYEKNIYTQTGGASPLVVYDHHWVDDENGRLDPNEESDLYIVVINKGNLSSTNTIGLLRTSSPYLTILDSISHYDSLGIGDTSQGDAYCVRVNSNCPHGQTVEMNLLVSSSFGSYESQFEMVIGMPYARSGIWAVHDTADFVIGVCANGGIGTTTWRGQGLGFIYPKSRQWSSSAMMHGSFLLGVAQPDTFWLADNYYGTPWQVTPQDFAIVESLRPVINPELGDQEYVCVFSDARHPEPKGITVTQRSFVSAQTQHKDFIVLEYRIHNNDTAEISGLWAGIACDFRTAPWNSLDQYDYAGTDSARTLAYIKASPETLALGVRPIYPLESGGFANCINHTTYINDGFTKSEKMMFLDGRLRSTTGTTQGNWHALVSSGPYTIPAGDSQIVAFVICGGRTVNQMAASSDSAFNWYEPQVGIVEEKAKVTSIGSIAIRPKLFNRKVTIHYTLNKIQPLFVTVRDVTGRIVDQFELPVTNLSGAFTYQPQNSQNGVLFIAVGQKVEKVVRIH